MIGCVKSQTEVILGLFREIFSDLAVSYPSLRKSFERDFLTLESRTRAEGLQFCTKTLPKLGKAFDAALAGAPFVVPREFKHSHGNQAIPAFLQGMFNGCFRSDGSLVPDLRQDSVSAIRQICYLVYKLELPFRPAEERAALDSFVATDSEFSNFECRADRRYVVLVAQALRKVLRGFNPKDILPRHGPGAVATGERLEEKWNFSRKYSCIHRIFPYYEYFVVGGPREIIDRLAWYRGLEPHDEGQARVVLVPKDSRGPRIISCEPLEFQYVQQGISRSLVRLIESHRLTKGHVNFTDQTVNQQLALKGSLGAGWATLDLKDASDRVSTKVVEMVFPDHVLPAFMASRSSSTLLPDGRVVRLNKFAPMGSALCFPVEALLFWAICTAAVRVNSRLSLEEASALVYVYGDDIIVPEAYADVVVHALQLFGLAVNVGKCCTGGVFRESCGMDACKGADVTPLKIRTPWIGEPCNGSTLMSYAEYANALILRGYRKAGEYLFGLVERVWGRLPYGTVRCGYPHRLARSAWEALFLNIKAGIRMRFREATHRVEVYAWGPRAVKRASLLDGWPRLLRNLVATAGEDPLKVVVPRATQNIRRWRVVG
jgi:hypothetical protein